MKSLSRWAWLLVVVISWLPHTSVPVQAQSGEQLWLLNQINNLRSQLGLHSYVWNPQLAAAAQQQSEYMAATGHISHQQSNGSMPSDRAASNGYTGSWVSENIYGGGMATASHAWNFWLNSSVHYAGMTHSRNNEIGIGVASGSSGQFYTLVFGYGSGVQAPPAQPLDNSASQDVVVDTEGEVDAVVEQPVPQAPPPTRVPPTLTFTPSPTVPTFTPTPTWTFTPTWTPSASPTIAPPTSTPISLPTAAAIVAVEPTNVVIESASLPTQDNVDPPRQKQVVVTDDEGFKINDLLPIFLMGQVILIGVGIYSLFFRSAKKT